MTPCWRSPQARRGFGCSFGDITRRPLLQALTPPRSHPEACNFTTAALQAVQLGPSLIPPWFAALGAPIVPSTCLTRKVSEIQAVVTINNEAARAAQHSTCSSSSTGRSARLKEQQQHSTADPCSSSSSSRTCIGSLVHLMLYAVRLCGCMLDHDLCTCSHASSIRCFPLAYCTAAPAVAPCPALPRDNNMFLN
jgi:hypothetical protein